MSGLFWDKIGLCHAFLCRVVINKTTNKQRPADEWSFLGQYWSLSCFFYVELL